VGSARLSKINAVSFPLGEIREKQTAVLLRTSKAGDFSAIFTDQSVFKARIFGLNSHFLPEKKMPKKTLLFAILVLTLLTTGFLFSYQSRLPDLPPGVARADWIPLTWNSGVQLTRDRKFLGPPEDLHGTLYVKAGNAWHRLYLNPSPVSILPIQ
jgi:hypothetical protein